MKIGSHFLRLKRSEAQTKSDLDNDKKSRPLNENGSLFLFCELLRGSFCRSFLRRLNEAGEGFRIVNREFGEHLTVDVHVVLLESIHELAVGDVVHAASRVDPANPELPIISLH